MLIAAGLDGIDRRLGLGPGVDDDLFELSLPALAERGIAVLPQSLNDAVTALEADSVVRAALGEVLASEFIRLKRVEWTDYARHVSAWELQRYATMF